MYNVLNIIQIEFDMGNTEPTNSKLKVYIQTEKLFYNSGSIIQGVVFVNAMDNFPLNALYLRVQGDQYCQWFEGSSKNRRKYTGNQNFYAIEHMLCKYDTMLQQGKYAYPFSLELSQNIPGSYSSSRYNAKIDYKLIAYFANFEDRKKRSYHSIPLIIRQPFRQQQCQYQGEVTQTPKTFFCCSKGQVYLHAKFKKNVCYEGQNIDIQVTCDNTKGRGNIKRFGVELVQYTFVSANNGVNRRYRNVVSRQFLKNVIVKGNKSQQMKVSIAVPEVSSQTAISTLVAHYYRIQVFADFGKIVQNQPCIISPIFVMKKDFKIKGQLKKIKQLNASEYKTVTKAPLFKAPQYWFRKNKNLEIMNFRLEDNVGNFQTQAMLPRA